MSRDWRPIDAVISDEERALNGLERISEMKLYVRIANDKAKTPFFNDEARMVFPHLCYLLDGFENRIYEFIKDDKSSIKIYKKIEKELDKLVVRVREQMKEDIRDISLGKVSVNDVVKKWFCGELDENFYYNEYNNELFMDWISQEIRDEKEKQAEKERKNMKKKSSQKEQEKEELENQYIRREEDIIYKEDEFDPELKILGIDKNNVDNTNNIKVEDNV